MSKRKYIDLVVHSLEEKTDVEEILDSQIQSLLYLNYLNPVIEKRVIRYCGITASFQRNNVQYDFIKGKNRKWSMHLSLFYSLRKYKPDAVLVHSLLFAWQIILLRLFLGRKSKILVLNHAETPFRFPKIIIQKIAAKCVDIYFLVSFQQADVWIEKKVFASKSKIREQLVGSTYFSYQDKEVSRKNSNLKEGALFLWCGSLNSNKDPFTVLNAFKKYIESFPDSYLYLVYNSTELLDEVKKFISKNHLSLHVILAGTLPHSELEKYYRAADYFILGSHRESMGFVLCEAMACGCIPIVSNIPSFKKMTDDGEYGFLFSPGDENGLYKILMSLHTHDKAPLIKKIVDKFNKDLSFQAIASNIEKEIIS